MYTFFFYKNNILSLNLFFISNYFLELIDLSEHCVTVGTYYINIILKHALFGIVVIVDII